jgi:hypothetical protein
VGKGKDSAVEEDIGYDSKRDRRGLDKRGEKEEMIVCDRIGKDRRGCVRKAVRKEIELVSDGIGEDQV